MIKRLLLALIFLTSKPLDACIIQLSDTILVNPLGKSKSHLNHAFKNCDEEIVKFVTEEITNVRGLINSSYLIERFPEKIEKVTPESIQILDLEEYISLSLNIAHPLSIKLTRADQWPMVFQNPQKEEMKIRCQACVNPGRHSIGISLKNQMIKVVTAEVLMEIEAFQLQESVPAHQTLNKNAVKKVKIKVLGPENYLPTKSEISFYKGRQYLPKGTILKNQHVGPIALIKSGHRVKVIYGEGPLKIEQKAMALSNANYGQSVHVKLRNKNRPIMATAVSLGVVRIEL